ncbi:HD-GYP domain-containing protein [Streptomyces glomeratus]|uniref:HD-GYP domain-containing protein n=1 Tax=Streptomyces glomeratus TaxID=284452 RepID=A0ABP6M437_9ACTN|nr:HD-GYP domain-containing protein [Streptomyces glomeratus]MCF1507945.1 HD-GYP domain-containing protein [Streptomyces glomeratus]
MGPVRPSAAAYVGCAVLGALLCVAPLPELPVPWSAIALLAALHAGCEQLPLPRALGRSRAGGSPTPPFGRRALEGMGTVYPVLLAGAFLLPPAAAAFVPLPGALLARVAERPSWLRRGWRAARLALAVWAASRVHWSLGGRDAVAGPHFPDALLTAGAAVLAFCLALTALDGGILTLAERVPARTAWRGLFLRSLAPVAVHGLAGLMMAVLWRSPYGPVTALLVLLPMYVSCWVFAQYHRERAAHQATIRALVQAVDLKDGYTRGHSERVGQASMMIARELGLHDRRVEVLRFAGILHDVGKLGVPTRLLRKDGPLTPEERRIIELHPEYGHEMVRGIGFLGEARSAILHHHERLDGTGYPYGLRGRQIPECARVVAVADAFDAMTSTRSYRRARPVAAALRELERCSGTQFDPAMVRALIRALDRHGWHPVVTAEEERGNAAPPPALPVAGQPAGRVPGGGGA